MSKGYIVIAQNSADTNYVRMAYALALSLKITQTKRNIRYLPKIIFLILER